MRNRLSSFGLVLVGLFATGYAVGERLPGHNHAHSDMASMAGMGASASSSGGVSADALGLATQSVGFRLVVDQHDATSLRFHLERDGAPVTAFTEQHEAVLHLMLIRRDLSGFQHVHPTMSPDGTWAITGVDLAEPGAWRVVADSYPTAAKGIVVLGTDVMVPGDMTVEPLPEPADMVVVDGLMIMRDGLDFTVTQPDGSPASGLAPYLGASAHLVAFRDGDLAYRHFHPSNDALGDYRFGGSLPGPGTYRLFLQVVHDGEVLTVPFTVVQP